jgi:hypothetical protein
VYLDKHSASLLSPELLDNEVQVMP